MIIKPFPPYFQSYCQKHSLNQKRRDSEDSDDDKGKKKHMTAEERSLAKRQKYVLQWLGNIDS